MPDLAEPAQKMESVTESQFDPRYGYNVFLHDGVAFTPDMTHAGIAAIDAFPLDPSDVTVVGYPKSGTNWVTIVLSRLYPGWACTKNPGSNEGGRVPDLHVPNRPSIGFVGFEHALASSAPRLMKSHANFRHMPRAFREDHIGKAIYITRNPKDVCDSYFNQLAGSGWFADDWTWDDHFNAFIEGRVFFGSWLENVVGWHAHHEEHGVLHIGYEEMNRDRRGTVEKIVGFLGPVPPGTIDRVLEETAFDAMQKGDLKKLYQPQMVRREGKAGGWRKRFSVDQNERMDTAFSDRLREAGVPIDYGA